MQPGDLSDIPSMDESRPLPKAIVAVRRSRVDHDAFDVELSHAQVDGSSVRARSNGRTAIPLRTWVALNADPLRTS